MLTSERLLQYYDFDSTILARVEEAAYVQNRLSFAELADQYGLADGPRKIAGVGMRHSVEYIDINPTQDHDETHVRVLYSPMGIPVDQSSAMRAMRLFASDPSTRLRVMGSPSAAGNTANRIPLGSLKAVAKGALGKAVEPGILALQSQPEVVSIDTLGYSYGADAAAAAAHVSSRYGFEVRSGVWVESASMKRRTPFKLLKDFGDSGTELDRYVDQTDSAPLREARELARNDIRYFMGLGRLSNIAIGSALARGDFARRVDSALNSHPELTVAIGWGTASELTDSTDASTLVESAGMKFGDDRVVGMEFTDMHHPGGDDIDLHAAIMLQGLRAHI